MEQQPPDRRPQRTSPTGRIVWARWVISTLLGGVVSYLAAVMLASLVGVDYLLLGGVGGAILGFAQWQVLRDHLAGVSGWRWCLPTTLAFGVGFPVFEQLGYVMAAAAGVVPAWERFAATYGSLPAMLGMVDNLAFPQALLAAGAMGAFIGALTGTAQWLALRGRSGRAGWWVPASSLGGMLGLLAGLGVTLLLGANLYGIALPVAVRLALGLFFGPWGIYMLASPITGAALAFLLRPLAGAET